MTAVTLSEGVPRRAGAAVRARGPGLEVVYVPMRPRAWRPNGLKPGRAVDLFRLERRGIEQALRVARADVVHAHWVYEYAHAALALDVPHLITCHDSPPVVARYFRRAKPTVSLYFALRAWMGTRALRRARHVSAVSPYMRDEIAPLTDARIDVIPNPVDAAALELGRARARPAGTPRIAMVCNGWGERKNGEVGLEALATFARRRGVTVHLFGHDFGPGEAAERWAGSRGLAAALTFHGPRSHRVLLEELAGMDVLFHPALEESFGMVIAEAMALGLPVVGGRESGAVPWVVGGTGGEGRAPGVLTDVRSVEACVGALDEVLDEGYAERSRQAFAQSRERFRPEAVAAAYCAAYERAIASARAAGSLRCGS